MNWLKSKIREWLGIPNAFMQLDARILDIERHFVTKRDAKGEPIQTLADVPLEKRHEIKAPRGLSMAQRRAYFEELEGQRSSIH